MPLSALRDDALRSTPDGFALRLSLPWIRSLPLTSLVDPIVAVDGATPVPIRVAVGDRTIAPSALAFERGWWFVQDRLVLLGRGRLAPGTHEVTVSFDLLVPYLAAGPDGPLRLPFRFPRALTLDAPAAASVSRDVA